MREIRKAIQYLLILAALVLTGLLAGVGSSREAEPEPAAAVPTDEALPPPQAVLTLSGRTDHPALMDRAEDGAFYPEQALTCGELAQALGALVEGMQEPASAMWLGETGREGVYRAAAALTAEGILQPGADGFHPDEAVTREALAGTLDRLGLRMLGEEQVLARAIAAAVEQGEMLEDTGQTVSGGQAVTRREGAVALERLAGREPDGEKLANAGLKPVDVSGDDWTWPYMADAALAGEAPVYGPGFFRVYGWLYEADGNGALVTDRSDGVWTFGADGRYTTGNALLDKQIAQALRDSGADQLTGQEALKAAYLYIKQNFEYKVTPQDMTPEEAGSTGWENTRASRFFRYKGGTCYGYAAAFGLMARALGENAQIVAAEINQYYGDHAFVIIPEDGVDWIYDVELEDARPERHQDLELFHIQNDEIYNYWYTSVW